MAKTTPRPSDGPVFRSAGQRKAPPGSGRSLRGFPLATVACYGPNGGRATKLVVGIVLEQDQEPVELRRWFTGGADIRDDPDTAEEVLAFIDRFGVRSVTMVDRIIGCPHEEGVDYEGPTCPH